MTEATDEAVHDPDIKALRDRIEATADASLDRDEAHVHLTLASGRNLFHHVPHARGSRERPLTDAELADKFLTLVEPVLDADPAHALLDRCRSLPTTPRGGLAALLAGTVPAY
jgi:2-methylcitrate dehydratase PrpD